MDKCVNDFPSLRVVCPIERSCATAPGFPCHGHTSWFTLGHQWAMAESRNGSHRGYPQYNFWRKYLRRHRHPIPATIRCLFIAGSSPPIFTLMTTKPRSLKPSLHVIPRCLLSTSSFYLSTFRRIPTLWEVRRTTISSGLVSNISPDISLSELSRFAWRTETCLSPHVVMLQRECSWITMKRQ